MIPGQYIVIKVGNNYYDGRIGMASWAHVLMHPWKKYFKKFKIIMLT